MLEADSRCLENVRLCVVMKGCEGCGGRKEAGLTERRIGVRKLKKGVEWVQSTQSRAMSSLVLGSTLKGLGTGQ